MDLAWDRSLAQVPRDVYGFGEARDLDRFGMELCVSWADAPLTTIGPLRTTISSADPTNKTLTEDHRNTGH